MANLFQRHATADASRISPHHPWQRRARLSPFRSQPGSAISTPRTNQIATPVGIVDPRPLPRPTLGPGLGQNFHIIVLQWAPAWFYSALCWLGQSYFDASNTQRSFGTALVGANVDPYQRLGATRLFVIQSVRNEFLLSIAADIDSDAPLEGSGVQHYERTDSGILQMYKDLAASDIFSFVTHAYVPGRVDIIPPSLMVGTETTGYDPATGLRRILMGSAMAQVVPIGDFSQVGNRQVYDESPIIVPLATSLVYDVTTHNAIGQTTFVLPVAYVVDQATQGQYAVNRFGATQTTQQGNQVTSLDYGQTAVFQNGPGYDATKAETLTASIETQLVAPDHEFVTTQFKDTIAYSIAPVGGGVVAGVSALTCTALMPLSAFSSQRILGFYRDNDWAKSLGYPIYDYQTNNSAFEIANVVNALSPELIYDPATPFLSGGNLPNVLAKFAAASYILSPDQLQQMIEYAGAYSVAGVPAGLSVMSAALAFDMSSNPVAGITDELTVPITATVTTTPPAPAVPAGSGAANAAAAKAATPRPVLAQAVNPANNVPIIARFPGQPILLPVGQGGNTPSTTPSPPTTVQAELDAFIPIEALASTGISAIPIGTAFFEQALGDGGTFQANASGSILNLCDAHRDRPALAPIDLPLATAGVTLAAGTQYVFSLQGTALTVRAADGTKQTATPQLANPDPQHLYVGAIVFTTGLTSIRLYPLLSLSLPAPAVGSNGIEQGEVYSVCLHHATKQSLLDILDADQVVVASGVAVTTPTPTDNSKPQTGDLYFGSFIGGAATMTVWAVPIFLSVSPSSLPGASFDGSMVLGAVSSGLPAYALQITDSSLFVFTNIDVDNGEAGSTSSSNVYIAGIAINSTPDDLSAKAFAPTQFVLGLVRQAKVGTVTKFVFVPETDSVMIGGKRYMLSVIELAALTDDPTQRPYPPNFWPDSRFWQFANRHNPYLDIRYAGATEDARIAKAQADTAAIAKVMRRKQEPMQMYLDTDGMVVWPILGFPFDTHSQSVDPNHLLELANEVLNLLKVQIPTAPAPGIGVSEGQQVVLPGAANQQNPYTYGVDFSLAATAVATSAVSLTTGTTASAINGIVVQNLTAAISTSPSNLDTDLRLADLQVQKTAANLAQVKMSGPQFDIATAQSTTVTTAESVVPQQQKPQVTYGFSVYNIKTGECYLIELVPTDLTTPNQLPDPTQGATYDPYYVRVVFVQRLKAYNMSIIVPSLAHDQFGHLAQPDTGPTYTNLIAKTDDFSLGYMWSLADQGNRFDTLAFHSIITDSTIGAAQTYVCTNLPYYSLGALATAAIADIRPITFACRRRNWNATCTLMVSTRPTNTHLFLAFGGGDLVPMRLDDAFNVDTSLPAHMYNLTGSFSVRQYEAVQTISVANVPFVIAAGNLLDTPVFSSFAINATTGTTQLPMSADQVLTFPTEIQVVGLASTTLADVTTLGYGLSDTNGFFTPVDQNGLPTPQFKVIPYNNLVYLVRAISNCSALTAVGGLGCSSGLLIDTFVPTSDGHLVLAQGARYKRSAMQFFGESYTPTTMVDSLDTLDFTSIAGTTFLAPTIFVPIPELDASKGFVADIANFLSEQFWTFIYAEVIAQPGETVNGVPYPQGFNLDGDGKPILSLQKLHFVYDPLAVLFTPNDLTHKYSLSPKQQVLALTNGQIQEGICWRTDHLQVDDREPPYNICAQQDLPGGWYMDRTNIIYSSHNRPVWTSLGQQTKGLSVNSFLSVAGGVYNIEESTLSNSLSSDQTGGQLISTVSSVANMLIAVLFDYDNNDMADLKAYDPALTNKGMVLLNGYLGTTGYTFSSPDHFDVNDVLPSQVPLLDQVANLFGYEVAMYDTDLSLPRQYWSLIYDAQTAPGLPNYIPNVPPSIADPTFSNRTRSLLLNFENQVRPQAIGVMDTFSSVVSINLHLRNGVTGSVFVNKKADRDVASLGTNPSISNSFPLYGLPTKYDFFLLSRDHYYTLDNATFELIDQGYAMCLVDDGTGTGNKVAKYYVDTDGNYYELYTYVLYTRGSGILETNTFTLRVTLAAPPNPAATPAVGETPNNVNPQDLVTQINKLSNIAYAVFGASSSGQPPAYIPIQAVAGPPVPGSPVPAAPISGAPGFSGYSLNVLGAGKQPVLISQIYSANIAYPIAGSTTLQPLDPKKGKPLAFYGSLSHGLDKQVTVDQLQSADKSSYLPRTTSPQTVTAGMYGGNGQGALIGTSFSQAFQGAGAIPPQIAANPNPGTTMKGDDSVFYTYNAVTGSVMDSTGKSGSAGGGQYFVDTTDPQNPIWVVISTPKFSFNGNSYAVNISTTLSDGVTSRYTLVVGDKSYLFEAGNTQVQVDRTLFTFNPMKGGIYTVTYASLDAPQTNEAPSPITLSPFSMTGGGLPANEQVTTVDVFNAPGNLNGIGLGVVGRQYSVDLIHGTVTITAGATSTTVPIQTGVTFASNSAYGYVIGFEDGVYTANGSPMFPYAASTTGSPASYPLMTAPQMFTFGSAFYTFDVSESGAWVSVTGNGQTLPINPYQFSLNGVVYIINTNLQPYTVSGGGNTVVMTTNNTQFVLDGAQYTVTLKGGSLAGATISGQFNINQGNVVAIEDYIYLLDTMNGQIVGNGTAYPLTTSGFTYTIATANNSFTVTTEANADTVTIGNIVYRIDGSSVVGDGITYPILVYRTFVDETVSYVIGNDGTVSLPQPLAVAAFQFTDGGQTYTVKQSAAFDGAAYYLITSPAANAAPQFKAGAITYQLRNDAAAITVGGSKTFLVNSGPLAPNQVPFGAKTLFFGRASDIAAFDGTHYFPIANSQFTDSNTGKLYTLSANTAVCDGNSYEIFSNLGQGGYFEVPGGPTYYVNIAVADFGTAAGDITSVFPISGSNFTIPLVYTITVAGSTVSVNALTFGAVTPVATLTAAANALTGGSFTDPVTSIVYTCVRQGQQVVFIDSNNNAYPLPLSGGNFTALVPVATGVTVAIDNQAPPNVLLVQNNSFIAGPAAQPTTYTVNLYVAFTNAAGPYWPMVAGRFIVPQAAPLSALAYTVSVDKTGKGKAIKGYLVSEDDEFSPDGKAVYAINAVNVTKATNQAQLAGQTVTLDYQGQVLSYTLSATTATIKPAGLTYNSATKQFAVTYPGGAVTYTVGANTVTDNRKSPTAFPATIAGNMVSFTDTIAGASFSFDSSGNNPISVSFPYRSQFFIDTLTGITFYVDTADNRVEALLILPETTRYAFTPADGNTYLIHYNAVQVVFPVISGANVNAGVATVGSDIFTVEIDEVDPVASGGVPVPVNLDSFEINGELYTITAGAVGNNYSACKVVGAGKPPFPFTGPNTFTLSDSTIVYTLHLDENNLPQTVTASFPVLPSRDLISVGDQIFVITYASTTTGTLRGQGQSAIPIANSAFTLSNPFDTTTAKFIFADADIYNAASVVGQFTVNQIPTFTIGSTTFTLDTTNLVVTDNNRRPYPLIANPMMFSINGANYLIDTNQAPHTIVGNNDRSPLQTDITVQAGQPIANSTFTLNGQIYAYVEDSQHNLLTITGTKSYLIAQPALTFKLDSSLLFTLSMGAPGAGNYAGSVAPIGKVTAGTTVLNVYPGTAESGYADFFTYKNVLYTFVKSSGVYVAVQKSYSVYVSAPVVGQQQLAVFDMGGTTYMVTDGTTAGDAKPAGINPGSMWSATSLNTVESQFGLVYGLAQQPTNVIVNGTTFQFPATDASGNPTLFDIIYTQGSSANQIVADVPKLLPSFTQTATFTFLPAYAPLTFETGGYNAFTTAVDETASPVESFSAAWNTPVVSFDDAITNLITPQGDFTVEFWHSIPVTPVWEQSIFTCISNNSLIYYTDITFPNTSLITVTVNDTVMQASTTPSTLTTGWRHVALSYTQPYVMVCTGSPFVVANGSGFNFERDFTIAMTVAASATGNTQGLLYKGTGSAIPAPQTHASFRVTLDAQNHVVLDVVNGDGTVGSFTGPALGEGFFQVLITKHTKTPMGSDDADTDPYSPPFDPNTMMKTPKGPSSVKIGNDNTIAVAPDDSDGATNFETFAASLPQQSTDTGYIISIAVRPMQTDGSYGAWTSLASPLINAADAALLVANTGAANLVIGGAYQDDGTAIPFGANGSPGNIREVYLFASAFRSKKGIRTSQGFVQIDQASYTDLQGAGLVGCWKAAYDPNGIVANQVDSSAYAASSNGTQAVLAPLPHREIEGITLYVNGSAVTLSPLSTNAASPSGFNYLSFNAGITYRIQEISFWSMARQAYQVINDMFGQLVTTNEPFLTLYLPGSFSVGTSGVYVPLLPMAKYIENVTVKNAAAFTIDLVNASLDLQGCPAIGRCGPLVSPNLYTPPGVALTVCDTPPSLTTYSMTVNSVTGGLAGVLNEAYVFISNNVLTVYAGKKVGDLSLVWVSQEQGDVQIIGYVEGAPPAPMANLTNKSTYAGATSVTFNAPISLSFKYAYSDDGATTNKGSGGASGNYDPASISAPSSASVTITQAGVKPSDTQYTITNNTPDGVLKQTFNQDDTLQKTQFDTPPKGGGGNMSFQMGIGPVLAALGFGLKGEKLTVNIGISAGLTVSGGGGTGSTTQQTATEKLDEGHKYTVKLEGTMAPYTGDSFMANLNSLSVPSATVGTPASKTPILPSPALGGFTTSNPPGALPKTAPTEERFGQRMFVPSSYGQAFVTSTTLDVYQQILLQTNTTFGFIRVPDAQIPRDLNILSFRMSSKYIRPGVLDGMIGYQYNAARLASGVTTWQTTTGQLSPVYDGNFSQGEVGHNASYMRVVEAYQLKKQIDQQAFNAMALYQSTYNSQGSLPNDALTPGLDFYNEYVWTARGGTQEVKHTYTTTYEEVLTTTQSSSLDVKVDFNAKVSAGGSQVLGLSGGYEWVQSHTKKFQVTYSGNVQFDVASSFDGIENDTQMRYAANNDAHFVMNFNSTFNPANQSGLNLVIGSDGLVYNIVPSVTSGAGLPISDNIDSTFSYQQPQPSYATGNANGLTGNLEPYDRPGKTKGFRAYTFYLQPKQQNADDFWNTVVDQNWLNNSGDTDAIALLSAKKSNNSIPWRLFHRVTYSERFLPPISTASTVVPQINPVFAVPVIDSVSDFLFQPPRSPVTSPRNPYNDVEANVVLVAPTASGLSIGTVPTSGTGQGLPVLPNNVIPFDIPKNPAQLVNWGDSANAKLLSALTLSITRQNTVPMSAFAPAGSTKVTDVVEPGGSTVYTVYLDPNGLTVNVPITAGTLVYQDVNGNPIQYYDGKLYHSLQADYVPTVDGTITYYIQPPSTYDQSVFNLAGDDDLYGTPGDQWRYYLVSGISSDMTASESLQSSGPFLNSAEFTGFTIADTMHSKTTGQCQVKGYVLVQGVMQWPNLNVAAESFADVQVYKAMSVLDTFPIGDPDVLIRFLRAQYPAASFVGKTVGSTITPDNTEIELVFAKNIATYFNTLQQALVPQ
ncbi:beta strand repeat-containing protein [Dyella acidisoli]|uniref:Uncharacterized protein n=1 Tax=Dyella acidisoli TaxID=1867834 RepID=A0ABQ5XKI9_9GAMM|nr:hypothetical protein [Dyella acidisoli]GLQ91517.1 hypothetical protein GCM10007901_04670 [Dyella acidisoli]